jgi:hypothetical protein
MEGPLLFGACCQRGSELTIGFVAALSILASSLKYWNFKLLCLWTNETCICVICGVPSEIFFNVVRLN